MINLMIIIDEDAFHHVRGIGFRNSEITKQMDQITVFFGPLSLDIVGT